MFRYPTYTIFKNNYTYVYKVSVYCLDPLNFRYFFLKVNQCSVTRSSKNGRF